MSLNGVAHTALAGGRVHREDGDQEALNAESQFTIHAPIYERRRGKEIDTVLESYSSVHCLLSALIF